MFELIATGQKSQQEVRRLMLEKGLRYSRAQFSNTIRNPIYIGKLKISAYKGEPEETVTAIHEPIIDEQTFYRVQAILSGKKPRKVSRVSDDLPLKGFLCCSHDHKMTGSCSRGNGGKYYYYHCQNINCERYRAAQVNDSYVSFLESVKVDPEIKEIYLETVAHFIQPDQNETVPSNPRLKHRKNG